MILFMSHFHIPCYKVRTVILLGKMPIRNHVVPCIAKSTEDNTSLAATSPALYK